MLKIISLELDHLEMYKKPSADSFRLKRSSNRARLGTHQAFIPENNKEANQNAPEVEGKLGWAYVEVLKDALEERV